MAQSVGNDYLGPLAFNAARSLIGGAVLLPLITLLGRLSGNAGRRPVQGEQKKFVGGRHFVRADPGGGQHPAAMGPAICQRGQGGVYHGHVHCAGAGAGHFVKRSPGARVWAAVALAVGGLYLLCWTGGAALGKGDALLLGCSGLFSLHILVIDHFPPGGRGEAVVHSVFYGGDRVRRSGAFV